jgi:hypothetical protein
MQQLMQCPTLMRSIYRAGRQRFHVLSRNSFYAFLFEIAAAMIRAA